MAIGFRYEAIFKLNKHKGDAGVNTTPRYLNLTMPPIKLAIDYSTPHYYTNHTDIFIAIVLWGS
jgi:hypothetical protein